MTIIQFSTFGLAHAMIAFKYRRIALTVPEQLDNLPPTVPSKCSVATEQVLLILNALVPFGLVFFSLEAISSLNG